MGLGLYTAPDATKKVSTTTPFSVSFDGVSGGEQVRPLFIRNDDVGLWYDEISLEVIGAVYSWRLLEKNTPPVYEEWLSASEGVPLLLSSLIGENGLGDSCTYLPLWINIRVPPEIPAQTIVSVTLRLMAKEHSVE